MNTDVLIVGGGLTGLAVATALAEAEVDYRLVEARDRLGGRILSVPAAPGGGDAALDLGPSWFWPGQPRVAALADRLGLTVFEQHAKGRTVFEDPAGAVRRDIAMALNPGAFRIEGGLARLTDRLAAGLDPARIAVNRAVTRVLRSSAGWRVDGADGAGAIDAKTVVLAMPPRLIADRIDIAPRLPEGVLRAMAAVPTWMAGHAKAAMVYERPFWRDDGLSGDAISHRGPLAQIHDASPEDGALGALFGFLGIGAAARLALSEDALRRGILEQLSALFGETAAEPSTFVFQDWFGERHTATAADETPPPGHPRYGPLPGLQALAADGVIIAATEVAPADGGLIEGALAAAEQAAATILGDGPRSV